MDFCLAPVLLAGYMLTVPVTGDKISNVDGLMFEAQTCERGLGANIKAAPSVGLYGAGLQYGLSIYDTGPWTSTFLIKAGLSHTTTPYPELPMTSQFEVGSQLLLGYDSFRVGVEWWHLSNAGLEQPNIGLDMVIIQTGWVF